MFRWLNKQGVSSNDGFALQSVDRFFYHYLEGGRVMKIEVEPLRNDKGEYYESISEVSLKCWQPPFGTLVVSQEERLRIQSNISAALSFMGIIHEFR